MSSEGEIKKLTGAHDAEIYELFALVTDVALARGTRAFVVGGAVRDALISNRHPLRDVDIVIEGDAREFAEAANEILRGTLQRFDRFYSAKIRLPGKFPSLKEIDFASTRSEIYARPGALPAVALSSLENDLRRRDFAINALALEVQHAGALVGTTVAVDRKLIVDQFDGQGDLGRQQLKILHPSSFTDDPTRLLRMVRYAVRFGFSAQTGTDAAFRSAVEEGALKNISAVRIYNELRKMISEPSGAHMLVQCAEVGLLDAWTPLKHLARAQIVAAMQTLPSTLSELALLRALHQQSSDMRPEHWGLSLSKETVRQITRAA